MFKFIKEEIRIMIVLLVALAVSFIYIFTSKEPEFFPHSSEIVLFLFSVSVSVIAAVIFYIFQFYIPAVKVRKIAKRELQLLCNQFVGDFTDILISCSKKEEIEQMNIKILQDFLTDEIAIHICKHFDIEAQANYSPKMSWGNRLAILGKEIKDRCDVIAAKYSIHLTEKMLAALFEIRSHAFVEFIRILNNQELKELQKKFNGRTWLPANVLADFFLLLLKFNKSLELEITFSSSLFQSQKGLYEKARIST